MRQVCVNNVLRVAIYKVEWMGEHMTTSPTPAITLAHHTSTEDCTIIAIHRGRQMYQSSLWLQGINKLLQNLFFTTLPDDCFFLWSPSAFTILTLVTHSGYRHSGKHGQQHGFVGLSVVNSLTAHTHTCVLSILSCMPALSLILQQTMVRWRAVKLSSPPSNLHQWQQIIMQGKTRSAKARQCRVSRARWSKVRQGELR